MEGILMFKKGDKVKYALDDGKLSRLKVYEVKFTMSHSTADLHLVLKEIPTEWFNALDFTAADVTDGSPVMSQGASKNDKEKIDLSLIPYVALREESKAFMVGEKKYGRYNYCKGHKASQLVAAAMRHLKAWDEGEELDPVDGQHHLGSVRA